MRFGWLSSGHDQAACNLLSDIAARAKTDGLQLEIGVVFCDREPGESPESDRFLELSHRLGIPVVTLSSAEARATAEAEGVAWRESFHDDAMQLLRPHGPDVLVLAGYMLIASPSMCRHFPLLNLHPALPNGPTGTWQQVIWSLLRERIHTTGAMVHLATPQLDRGPVIAYDHFDISHGDFTPLWKALRAKLKEASLEEIIASEGESEPLFAAIRAVGEQREIPLLYQTLKQFAEGQLRTTSGAVFSESVRLPIDATEAIEAEVGTPSGTPEA